MGDDKIIHDVNLPKALLQHVKAAVISSCVSASMHESINESAFLHNERNRLLIVSENRSCIHA